MHFRVHVIYALGGDASYILQSLIAVRMLEIIDRNHIMRSSFFFGALYCGAGEVSHAHNHIMVDAMFPSSFNQK